MRLFLSILITLCLSVSIAWSQDISVLERLREQAGGIADSAAKIALRKGITSVGLSVEGRGSHIVVQNAFIEALNQARVSVIDGAPEMSSQVRLRVLILGQAAQAVLLTDGRYERTVRTSIEPRLEMSSSEIQTLGILERISKDTVQSAVTEEIFDGTADESTVERLMMPLIVVTSVVLVVYLLFTVRS
jgi:hypothetical protein